MNTVPEWKQRINYAGELLKISNDLTRVVAESHRVGLVSRDVVNIYYSALVSFEDSLKAYAQVRSIYTLVGAEALHRS